MSVHQRLNFSKARSPQTPSLHRKQIYIPGRKNSHVESGPRQPFFWGSYEQRRRSSAAGKTETLGKQRETGVEGFDLVTHHKNRYNVMCGGSARGGTPSSFVRRRLFSAKQKEHSALSVGM